VSKKDTNVGKATEQEVVRYLRPWWPGAERKIRTGYRVNGREMVDHGDVMGTPGICWQIKSLRTHDPRSKVVDPTAGYERAIPEWLMQTEAQRLASGSDLGFLVVRRWGTTDVGRWWVFQRLAQLHRLLEDMPLTTESYITRFTPGALVPVRMDMASLIGILDQTGWTAGSGVVDEGPVAQG
jgi:hypothetical protein